MTTFLRVVALVLMLLTLAGPSIVALQSQPPKQQSEFIPIDQLPPQDQLPAAPLLVGAYAFALVALSAYLFSVARRLSAVQREVERLEAEFKRSGRT